MRNPKQHGLLSLIPAIPNQYPPSGKPPVPKKSWDVLSFKPGKKVVLGIIVVIIIVAVVLGAFFIYPMIDR